MKKYIFLFLVIFGQIVNAQFVLNTNPQNPTRTPNPDNEMGIVLSKNSPKITIMGGNRKQSTNFLLTGMLVIIDKETGYAKWIAICGNEVVAPKNWKPEGKIIRFWSEITYKIACEEMKIILSKLEKLQEGMDELLERPSSNLSLTEIKIMFEKTLENRFPQQVPNESSWLSNNWGLIAVIVAIIAGGLYAIFHHHDNEVVVTTPTPPETGKPPGGIIGPAFKIVLGL